MPDGLPSAGRNSSKPSRVASNLLYDSVSGMLVVGLVVLLLGAMVRMISSDLDIPHVWRTGDYLVNYEGGFVRRGLLGQSALLASDWLGIDPVVFVIAIQTLAFTLFVSSSILLYRSFAGTFWGVLALFSPAFLLFHFWDPEGAFRKEILLLGAFGMLLAWSRATISRKKARGVFLAAWPVAFLVLGLAHEALVFFSPLALLALSAVFLEKNWNPIAFYWTAGATALASFIVVAVSVRFPGTPESVIDICDSVVTRGVSSDVCGGAISFMGWTSSEATQLVLERPNLVYLPVALLAVAPFTLIRFGLGRFTLLSAAVSASIPLFVIGSDWGRWIHVVISMITLISFRFGSSIASLHGKPLRDHKAKHQFVFAVVAFVYVSVWRLPHYAGFPWEGELFNALLLILYDLAQGLGLTR